MATCLGRTRVLAVCAFVFRLVAGFGLGFGTTRRRSAAFGGAVAARAGVDVATGRGVGAGRGVGVAVTARWTSGDGADADALGLAAAATGAEATTGASGVGTAAAGLDGFEDVGADGVGGSSGAGIGVPPAAQPVAGQASATRQAPNATDSRLSRRDDGRLNTTSPLSESHGTSVDARVSIRARVAADGSAATLLARTQRFLCFGIPPWIACDHAPPRWSSHAPWPATWS
ncbi:MAG TPA: hypothetical protein VFJ60_11765 [Gaiella sp.]|nr:hypothetical protein [Gaiella sp.]